MEQDSHLAVEVRDLRRVFNTARPKRGLRNFWRKREPQGTFCAVDGINFSIRVGERIAFVGPNGAGKSTTIKMLSGILAPTSGEVRVLGLKPTTERSKLAYSIAAVFGQRSQLWYHLPVIDSWRLLGKIYGVDDKVHQRRLDELCGRFNVRDLALKQVKHLSLGERMRCELIGCFLHAPKVLFLDEPTIGLDVEAKSLMRDLVKDMCATREGGKAGCTLLLTSHDTGDMESVCDRVIMINHGKVVFDDSVDTLRRTFVKEKILSVTTHDANVNWEHVGLPLLEKNIHTAKFRVDIAQCDLQGAMSRVLATARISDIGVGDPPMEETIKKIYASTSYGSLP